MLPSVFKNCFQFCYDLHHYSTISSMKGHLHKKSFNTNNFGKLPVTLTAIKEAGNSKRWDNYKGI